LFIAPSSNLRGTAGETHDKPTAILVLGGDKERESYATDMAVKDQTLQLWLSSGQTDAEERLLARLPEARVHLDWRALDTVTNFSTMVAQLKHNGVKSVYLVTSDYHIRRAAAVAWIMLGSSGISYTPISVPSVPPKTAESFLKVYRDVVRAIIWLFTGSDMMWLVKWLVPGRAQISNTMVKAQQRKLADTP
jgi:uncharacterized SAM-binding protein YcdF (DUF218 family)